MKIKGYFIVALLSLLISFFLYGNSIPGEFVYDDNFFAGRQELRNLSIFKTALFEPYIPTNKATGGGFYRPLWVMSLAANYILFGESPVSFHVVNILLYAGILFLLFHVLETLLNNTVLSGIVMSIFAFLPIHTEVVANIKSRDELLSLFLLLISYTIFFRAMRKYLHTRLLWVSAIVFGLAVLAKESVLLGPVIFLAIYWYEHKSTGSYLLKMAIPFFIVGVMLMGLRTYVLRDDAFFKDEVYFILNPLKGAPYNVQCSTALKVAGIYLVKTVIPYNLTASYDFNHVPLINQPFASWESIVGFIGLIGISIIAWKSKAKPLRFGAIWFLVSYLIISKFFFTKGALMGERLLFFPSVGLAMIFGYGIYRASANRRFIAIVVTAVLCFIYTMVIIPRNLVWLTPKGFFEQMVIDAPDSAQAQLSVTRGYFDQGKLNDAKKHVDLAYAIYPDDPSTRVLLGKLAYIAGEYDTCEKHTLKAMQIDDGIYDAHHFYLLCILKLGKYQDALDIASLRLERAPDDQKITFVVAEALYNLGRTEEALSDKYIWIDNLSKSEREQILKDF